MPRTSHSLDSARRRWICCSRSMSGFSGSSRRFASSFGFSLLKVSTAVLKAPLVSLPMHHVTFPEAFCASEGSSVLAPSAPPPPSSPPPHAPSVSAPMQSPRANRYLTILSSRGSAGVPVQGSSRRKYLYPDQSPPNSASGTRGAVDTNGVSTESAADAVYDLQPAWVRGSISRRDARYLHERALAATGGPPVEVGNAAGVSTAFLGAAAGRRSSGSRVASYDISPTYYADESRRTGDAAREMLDADRLGLVEFRNPATALDVRDEHPEESLGVGFFSCSQPPTPSATR